MLLTLKGSALTNIVNEKVVDVWGKYPTMILTRPAHSATVRNRSFDLRSSSSSSQIWPLHTVVNEILSGLVIYFRFVWHFFEINNAISSNWKSIRYLFVVTIIINWNRISHSENIETTLMLSIITISQLKKYASIFLPWFVISHYRHAMIAPCHERRSTSLAHCEGKPQVAVYFQWTHRGPVMCLFLV